MILTCYVTKQKSEPIMSLLIKPYISHFRFKLQSCLSDQKSGSRLLPRKTIDEKKRSFETEKIKIRAKPTLRSGLRSSIYLNEQKWT